MIRRFKIDSLKEAVRVSDYLYRNHSNIFSRNGAYKAIKRGEVKVNDSLTTTGYFLKEGDLITYNSEERKVGKIFKLKLEIVYEDQFLAVVNKPPGFEVMGNKFKTIENSLQYNLEESNEDDKLLSPKPVHRLDYSTSGLLVIAKTQKAIHLLSKMFENREIKKLYKSIVIGEVDSRGEFNTDIDGREAITRYWKLGEYPSLKNGKLTYLKLSPITGRTHQLRVHLSRNGTPILGDKLYGIDGLKLVSKGIFLSSTDIEFQHPIINKLIKLSIEPPAKFKSFTEREQKRWKKYNYEN